MTDERKPPENEGGGSGRIPNQRELEKELSDYLSKKYGSRVKIISPFNKIFCTSEGFIDPIRENKVYIYV